MIDSMKKKTTSARRRTHDGSKNYEISGIIIFCFGFFTLICLFSQSTGMMGKWVGITSTMFSRQLNALRSMPTVRNEVGPAAQAGAGEARRCPEPAEGSRLPHIHDRGGDSRIALSLSGVRPSQPRRGGRPRDRGDKIPPSTIFSSHRKKPFCNPTGYTLNWNNSIESISNRAQDE